MRLPEPLRTTSFRLAVGYAGLFLVSVLVIMGTTYLAATAEMAAIVRGSIAEDMQAFRGAFAQEGTTGLAAEFAERLAGAADDRFFLFLPPGDANAAGNLPKALWHSGWTTRRIDDRMLAGAASLTLSASRNADGEVLLTSMGEEIGGYRVLVGRNAHGLDEMREIMLSALLWGCLATTILALAGGYIVSIGPTRRVDEIAATTRLIVAGRLDLRLPMSGRRDELDRLAGDINAMLGRIETLMQSLAQVSTDIAHDLRTPLARLRQRLDAIGRRAEGRADIEADIEIAAAETDAIIETFNALLRIAQIEAGARKARFGPVDLSLLAERLCDVYAEVAFDAGHRWAAGIAPGQTIEGDADLLTQALANLIENAINHTVAPALICVSVKRLPAGIAVEVADSGPGVPEDERDKIFRRLYRLDRSRTTPGSGLGLSLVAAIVELHEARIEALDNAPGLRMRMVFPRPPAGFAP